MATVLMASAAQEDVDEQRTIRNDAAIVRKLFLDNLSCYRENNADGHVIKSQIQDEFGRFNTWTANNHVFSPVLASLDTRFLHTPSFTEQLLTQLEALQSRLEELYKEFTRIITDTEQASTPSYISPEASPSSYSANIIRRIHVTMDWLQRFSNLMTIGGLPSHGPQDDSQRWLTDEAGVDITDSVWDRFKHMVLGECPNSSGNIALRIVTTMTIRQKNIICRRSAQRPRDTELEQLQRALPNTSTRVWMDLESGRAILPRAEEHYSNAASATNDSNAESSLLPREDRKENASPYTTSWTKTKAFPLNEDLRSSELSRPGLVGQACVCGYCHMTVSRDEALDDIDWENHFEIDLAPYICLFDKCSQPYQMFTSKNDWLSHMGTKHCLKWRCVATGHEPILFNDEELFIGHMLSSHPGSFREDKLRFIANNSTHISMPIIKDCPFCLESEAAEDLEGHVVRHLHHFALESVPGGLIAVRHSRSGSTDKDGTQGYDEHHKVDPPSPNPISNLKARLDTRAVPATLDSVGPGMISPTQLKEMLDSPLKNEVLLLDLRVSPQYAQSRIRSALNLCIPTTLLKRATFNLQKLQQTFQGNSDQEKFAMWQETKYLVVYDAFLSEKKDAVSAINIIKKFTNEGYTGQCLILRGGFNAFAASYPSLIEKSATSEQSPGRSIPSTLSHVTAPRNRMTAGRVDTASTDREDYRKFYNPPKT